MTDDIIQQPFPSSPSRISVTGDGRLRLTVDAKWWRRTGWQGLAVVQLVWIAWWFGAEFWFVYIFQCMGLALWGFGKLAGDHAEKAGALLTIDLHSDEIAFPRLKVQFALNEISAWPIIEGRGSEGERTYTLCAVTSDSRTIEIAKSTYRRSEVEQMLTRIRDFIPEPRRVSMEFAEIET